MKTYSPSSKKLQKKWVHIDASNKILGKVAVEAANILIGKNKATYSPHMDLGDKVVVTNAKNVVLTGRKLKNKIYYHHTGYPGGLRSTKAEELMNKKPTEILRKAVSGMLPKNKLHKVRMSNLYIYESGEHPHNAQLLKNA
ncbi:50S ribosomal protein L13 [candidate division WWE3 bacterium RIFCSPHIGHO2_12_FULL_38_15]|uniref:Large ribosomal subunit protein uL13 n=1 Tax=candidate division WWE3 bacterium RIFCSPHIGHO2_02_FULL_38_14 TaxID=1802620 RepID=A0A1F4VB12_UNCKA|nr:MAG: 50S ribosomal protein L13 [candidate division WWE3 bacterium RIFCSPHIGHO2_01_FULL_38_45]OGC49053.1 MAG: 50S ribosomal protein L13 [candidate division WWE3 bacterium RIFCSPHIGHO2_12_FULL_38_15]OGC53508.1 MAG: 50S ribosomal protein L13 [candidate division WWE3 bacterium RIFCSPLOWO2_01_FULL_37_24]OGC54412.1 MAG: 50S ribosomal protein L13 [candidate division WWE3 bacterium RIFCSPHIGHO2_02_FULL_38_14]HLB51657.1 50S ribosomal protein L13 [Patescibacteria group bacterium]